MYLLCGRVNGGRISYTLFKLYKQYHYMPVMRTAVKMPQEVIDCNRNNQLYRLYLLRQQIRQLGDLWQFVVAEVMQEWLVTMNLVAKLQVVNGLGRYQTYLLEH